MDPLTAYDLAKFRIAEHARAVRSRAPRPQGAVRGQRRRAGRVDLAALDAATSRRPRHARRQPRLIPDAGGFSAGVGRSHDEGRP